MRTTAVLNLKGGVAKTTTVISMAAILAKDYDAKVLVVDADSQCNTSEFLGEDKIRVGTLADGLRRGDEYMFAHPTNIPGVDLLPADDSLMDADLSAIKSEGLHTECLALFKAEHRSDYDYMLIDCPPAFNAATAAALLAADDVVIPIKLDAFSLRGMGNLIRQISNMRKLNPGLKVAGLLPTMCYSSPTIRESLNILLTSEFHVFPRIRRTAKVDDMTFAQAPITISSPRSAAAVDYKRFVAAYVKNLEVEYHGV